MVRFWPNTVGSWGGKVIRSESIDLVMLTKIGRLVLSVETLIMNWTSKHILDVLDACAEQFTFPVLDNGYVYLAATRMSVYRSNDDWAIVIEVFGFSPRSGSPDVQIYTYSSKLRGRNTRSSYVIDDTYKKYLDSNPFNESRFIYPVENSDWQDEEDGEFVKSGVCLLRGSEVIIPEASAYKEVGIELAEKRPLTFEFCRLLSDKYRDQVLCTEAERRISVSPELELLLRLDEWNHPDVSGGELPSASQTFNQLAEVIVAGDVELYKPTRKQNTHWKNWPESGAL